jgi:hypothetical protein
MGEHGEDGVGDGFVRVLDVKVHGAHGNACGRA